MLTTATTIKENLEAGRNRLTEHGIELAGMKCEWLLSHLLKCRRLELALHYQEALPTARTQDFADGLARLAAGEPVQYVTGETEFMGLPLNVDKRVLIPRPETEQLVEYALKTAMAAEPDSLHVADVGTGSGCIAIALTSALPESIIHAFDISEQALEVARENARRLKLHQIHFQHNDLLENQTAASMDLVIANLPYIGHDDMPGLPGEVKDFEPGLALEGGGSGTELVERLVAQCATVLKPGGHVFLEIGETQGDALNKTMARHGYSHILLRTDLAGRPRFLYGSRPW